jgi:solute carrier family 25 iron transporter 28/37
LFGKTNEEKQEMMKEINKQKKLEKVKAKYFHISDTAKNLWAKEGGFAFFKGLIPRLIVNIPASALSWSTYEFVKKRLYRNSSQ